MVLWFSFARDVGDSFSLGGWFGYEYASEPLELEELPALAEDADEATRAAHETRRAEHAAAKAAHDAVSEGAGTFWFYQYMVLAYAFFLAFWYRYSPHRWSRWSVFGSAAIIFVTWFQVQLDVMINEWFGTFYDLIPDGARDAAQRLDRGLFRPVAHVRADRTRRDHGRGLHSFLRQPLHLPLRTAMNDHYMSLWGRVRHIEGASQRVQEDTMRFAAIMEHLGVSLIDSVMTLIAFLPILWGLSAFVTHLPIVGEVPQALVFVAIVWSIFGTGLLALAGIRLPGLEFRNQRVEAAYRKELVYGEDDAERAQPPTVHELFDNVRRNYFRLYLNYLYFNIARYGYLQVGVLLPYIVLGPTIVAAGFTLGVMQQIVRAFGRVENSFQYLVNSWTTIVELLSIYKRLQAFEAAIKDQPLPKIDRDFMDHGGDPA